MQALLGGLSFSFLFSLLVLLVVFGGIISGLLCSKAIVLVKRLVFNESAYARFAKKKRWGRSPHTHCKRDSEEQA